MRYFVTVAEELSFRRAAHRLYISHPALSQRIHDLENELGVKLFERNSRRVELTEIGRVFLGGARQALKAANQAVKLAQEAAKGERGRLVIGCIGPMVGSFLPDALARFREQRPLVEATVSHMNSRTQIEALLDGSIMLGIGHFGSVIDQDEGEQLCSHLLLRSSMGIACSKNRRFPKGAAPKLRDFRKDKFLSIGAEYGGEYENRIRALCRRFGRFEPQIVQGVNSTESLISMLAGGTGVFLGVELAIRGRLSAIDFYPLNERESQFELSAIWKNKPQGDSTIIQKFIDVMDESIKLSGVV